MRQKGVPARLEQENTNKVGQLEVRKVDNRGSYFEAPETVAPATEAASSHASTDGEESSRPENYETMGDIGPCQQAGFVCGHCQTLHVSHSLLQAHVEEMHTAVVHDEEYAGPKDNVVEENVDEQNKVYVDSDISEDKEASRRERARVRMQEKRKVMPEEEKVKIREKQKLRARQRRLCMSEAKKAEVREKDRLKKQVMRSNLSDDDIAIRKGKDRLQKVEYKLQSSQEELADLREKNRIQKMTYRQNASEEQRATWRERDKLRKREIREVKAVQCRLLDEFYSSIETLLVGTPPDSISEFGATCHQEVISPQTAFYQQVDANHTLSPMSHLHTMDPPPSSSLSPDAVNREQQLLTKYESGKTQPAGEVKEEVMSIGEACAESIGENGAIKMDQSENEVLGSNQSTVNEIQATNGDTLNSVGQKPFVDLLKSGAYTWPLPNVHNSGQNFTSDESPALTEMATTTDETLINATSMLDAVKSAQRLVSSLLGANVLTGEEGNSAGSRMSWDSRSACTQSNSVSQTMNSYNDVLTVKQKGFEGYHNVKKEQNFQETANATCSSQCRNPESEPLSMSDEDASLTDVTENSEHGMKNSNVISPMNSCNATGTSSSAVIIKQEVMDCADTCSPSVGNEHFTDTSTVPHYYGYSGAQQQPCGLSVEAVALAEVTQKVKWLRAMAAEHDSPELRLAIRREGLQMRSLLRRLMAPTQHREKEREMARLRMAFKRQTATEEERELAKEKGKMRMRWKRMMQTQDERDREKEKARVRMRLKRMQQSAEERERRKERERIRKRQEREMASEEQKQTWRDTDRNRKRTKRRTAKGEVDNLWNEEVPGKSSSYSGDDSNQEPEEGNGWKDFGDIIAVMEQDVASQAEDITAGCTSQNSMSEVETSSGQLASSSNQSDQSSAENAEHHDVSASWQPLEYNFMPFTALSEDRGGHEVEATSGYHVE